MHIKKRSKAGMTFVELLIASSIFALMMLAVAPIFNLSLRQSSSTEARLSLKSEGQKVMREVGRSLQQCKRIFQNSTDDNAYLARVQLGALPGALTGSKLPTIQETGAISPNSASFVASSVGNRIFIAGLEAPLELTPADSLGSTRTVRVDTYRFHYYYLANDGGPSVSTFTRINMYGWDSVKYADYIQLNSITDSTQRTNAAVSVYGSGVLYAWDTSAASVSNAFYDISSGGAIALNSSHNIPAYQSGVLIKPLVGTMGSGYRYSVAPNTGSFFSTDETVPEFGVASGSFPSGFETVIVGPTSARQVFMRLVLVAQGAFKGYITNEDVLSLSVRDVW